MDEEKSKFKETTRSVEKKFNGSTKIRASLATNLITVITVRQYG